MQIYLLEMSSVPWLVIEGFVFSCKPVPLTQILCCLKVLLISLSKIS